MKAAALGSWIATAVLGFSMLTVWLGRGGLRRSSASGRRLTPHLLSDHIIPAVSALVLWIVFLVSGDVDLAWIAFGMLIVVGVVGFTNFLLWQRRRLGVLRATRSRWNVAADQLGGEHIPRAALPGGQRGAAWRAGGQHRHLGLRGRAERKLS